MTIKKRTKKIDSWQWGGWLTLVNYTTCELNSIAKSIFDGHYSGKSTLIINSIKNAASLFLSSKQWDAEKPLPSNTKRQLKKLNKSVSNLLDAFELDEPAMDWLQFHADMDWLQFHANELTEDPNELTEDPNYLDIVRKTLENFVQITSSSARSFEPPQGRPKDEANVIFLLHLAKIWEVVRGEAPRHEQLRETDEYDQPFYHFVDAVCDPLPLANGIQITHRRVKTFLQGN